ncbi:MAG: hypothetical protein ACPG47_03940 [Leucothrix sp.]
MTNKYKCIASICLSACLALCGYPLTVIQGMQLEHSHLLFFAFAAASLLMVVLMARQADRWRKKTPELLIYGLTAGVSTVLLHYSFLLGRPVAVVATFSTAVVVALFLDRLGKGENLVAIEFSMILSLLMLAISTLFILSEFLVGQWWPLLAILAGIGFYRLSLLGRAQDDIPVLSRVAALFVVSTWLVGMVLIFSPHSTTFPEENATVYSALYGLLILVPIMVSLVFILMNQNRQTLLLWLALLLSVNFISMLFDLKMTVVQSLWLLALIMLAQGIQFIGWRALAGVEVDKK